MNQNPSDQMNSGDVHKIIKTSQTTNRLKGILSFLIFVVGVFLAAFLINQFIFQSYFVDGTSMKPTLQNNDRLIIEKVSRSFSLLTAKSYVPARGQIVVLDSSLAGFSGKEEQLIKRVIGLPGETVQVKNGTVTVKSSTNPTGFNADKTLGLELGPTYSQGEVNITLGNDEVFVLGDNRGQNGSYDSRAFGAIKTDKLEGRLWVRILPINKAQLF